MRRSISLLVFGLLTSPLTACVLAPGGSEGDASQTGNRSMARREACIKTWCDSHRTNCDSLRAQCNDRCASLENTFMAECYAVCEKYDCTCSAQMVDRCQERGFRFDVTGPRDEAVFEACRRAVTRDTSCRETLVSPDCELAARVGGEWSVAAYDCFARTPCGKPQSCSPPASSQGREFCDALAASCGSSGYRCTEAHEASLATAMAWYAPATLSAAAECLKLPSCEDKAACHDAWLDALALK